MHCRSALEVFFRVSFFGISSSSSMAFSCLTSMYGPVCGSCVQWFLCLLKATSFQFFWTNLKYFLSLDRTRCPISFPFVPNGSSTKRIDDLCHRFSCSWDSCYEIQFFFQVQLPFSDCSRDSVRAPFVPSCCAMVFCPRCSQVRSRDCRIQHVTASIGSRGNHACHSYAVLCQGYSTTVGSIVLATCRFLQFSSNMWRMICFWWRLTYDITIHIIRLHWRKLFWDQLQTIRNLWIGETGEPACW